MKRISREVIAMNTRLTDYPDFREIVFANAVRGVPGKLKSNNKEPNSLLVAY